MARESAFVSPVPLVTHELAGTGGELKRDALDFVVTEIPLYEPAGDGEHVYVRHRRENATTRDVVLALARAFRLEARDIGYAGLKDKRAVATQTFSLHLPRLAIEEVAPRLRDAGLAGEVLDVRRHRNKLRRGHLFGNHFEIRLCGVVADAQSRAEAIADVLASRGLPNAFGPQRYGDDGRNAAHGRALLARPRSGWLARLQLSAWQSALFDVWLAARMERGWFERVFAGDVAKKLANGALFDVTDEAADNERCARHEITHTGPMFGSSMRPAGGQPGALENEILAASGVTAAELARARLEGTRRAGRIFVDGLALRTEGADLLLTFRLPKGSYATIVLREFTKNDLLVSETDDEG